MLAAAMMLPTAAMPVSAEPEETEAAAEAEGESSAQEAPDWTERSDKDVFAKMRKVAENENLEFWAWDESKLDTDNDEQPEDLFALVNKANGYVWWSSPVNAGGDALASPVLRSELRSGVVLTAAQILERSTVNARSGDTLKTGITFSDIKNGVKVTYFFRKTGIKIPFVRIMHLSKMKGRTETPVLIRYIMPEGQIPSLP